MSNEFIILAGTAASIGFIHTVFGPDHYLPFIVLSKARQWSTVKTFIITFLCGIGHVLSSVVLGLIGVTLGIALFKLKQIESFRGELAGWFLLAFGFTYFIWGIHKVIRNKSNNCLQQHKDEDNYTSHHKHIGMPEHIHSSTSVNLTPWILFIIFIFGPCEPLIPLVMYPAAKGNMKMVVITTLIFGSTTIITMLSIVLASSYGLSKLPLRRLEKYSHALAGLMIILCGVAIKFLGL